MSFDEQLSRFRVGAIRWITVHSAPPSLHGLMDAIDRQGEVLRAMPRRRTLRVTGPPSLIVKHFFPSAVWGRFKSILLGDPAFREWTALRLAGRRRLPVPTPLAVGWRRKFLCRESILVIEDLSGAIPLGTYLYGNQRPTGSLRRRIVDQAARVLRRAHDAGMFHKDLHLENLMVRNGVGYPEIFLIDFQRIAFRAPLGLRARIKNLAQLHGGTTEASHAERLRFLKAYFSDLPGTKKELRLFLGRLEKQAMKHRLGIWRSRQKRCLRNNRDFVKLRFNGYVGAARHHWSADPLLSSLRRPSELFSSCMIVKESRTTSVGTAASVDRGIHVKRYNYQGIGYALKDLFRTSRAMRVWIVANSCVMRGISVARPIAYLERRRSRVLLDSFLVTETVEGQTLSDMMRNCGQRLRDKRALIRDLGRYISQMHHRQVANRDLKEVNLIVSRQKADRYLFSIVDFDGLRVGPVSRRTRIKNLARLNHNFLPSREVTRTDRLRFLTAYLSARNSAQWKTYWRRISVQISR